MLSFRLQAQPIPENQGVFRGPEVESGVSMGKNGASFHGVLAELRRRCSVNLWKVTYCQPKT